MLDCGEGNRLIEGICLALIITYSVLLIAIFTH